MKLRLLEIELNTNKPDEQKRFYNEVLGLDNYVDEDGLKVFSSGVPDLDFIKSKHFPGQVSLSFYSDDIKECVKELKSKGIKIIKKYGFPVSAIVIEDPDGCRIEIKKQHG